jgi:hypothetical protein
MYIGDFLLEVRTEIICKSLEFLANQTSKRKTSVIIFKLSNNLVSLHCETSSIIDLS